MKVEARARLATEKTKHDAEATAAAGEPSTNAEIRGVEDIASWRAEQENAVGEEIRVGAKVVKTRRVRNSSRNSDTAESRRNAPSGPKR